MILCLLCVGSWWLETAVTPLDQWTMQRQDTWRTIALEKSHWSPIKLLKPLQGNALMEEDVKKLSVNYNFENFPKANFDIVWCSIDIVKIIWMRWQCVKLKRRNIVLKLMMSILSYFAQISAHSEVTDHRFFIRSIVRHSDFITRVRPYWCTFLSYPIDSGIMFHYEMFSIWRSYNLRFFSL